MDKPIKKDYPYAFYAKYYGDRIIDMIDKNIQHNNIISANNYYLCGDKQYHQCAEEPKRSFT